MSVEEAADAREAQRSLWRAVCLLEKAKCVGARNLAVAAHNETTERLALLAPADPAEKPPARRYVRFRLDTP